MTREVFQALAKATERAKLKHPVFPTCRKEQMNLLTEEFLEAVTALNDSQIEHFYDEIEDIGAVIVRILEVS